jgi:methyltransferase (TIGR00027 family)
MNRESSQRESSQTALTAAAARAAHLLVDRPPFLFEDTLAIALLGDQAEEFLAYHRLHGDHVILRGARSQVTARARFTEDVVAAGPAEQYVILGAGLDSYAYRVKTPGLRVFEVDHPATQERKRRQAQGLPVLSEVAYVPVDFERDAVTRQLARHGFDRTRPAVVSWLGVTMYLTRDAIAATLADLATLPAGVEVVFDYMLPESLRDPDGQQYAEQVATVAADRGEPWLTCLTPQECTELLQEAGFGDVRQLTSREALPPQMWQRQDSLTPSGLAMLAHARR